MNKIKETSKLSHLARKKICEIIERKASSGVFIKILNINNEIPRLDLQQGVLLFNA